MRNRSSEFDDGPFNVVDNDFDVVIASDLRFPGGTSHSIAEEIVSQSCAGYRTGLAHMNGPLVRKLRPFNPLIREQVEIGAAQLIVSHRQVHTRLLVIRHPAMAQWALDQLPPVEAEHVIVVANAGPTDIDGTVHYDPGVVTQRVRDRFGVVPVWAPIGPLVRSEIESSVEPRSLSKENWFNIIDVSEWEVHRPRWSADRPVIGRHSRPSSQKWPEKANVLRQVYPVDGSWDVRVLGGAGPVEELLGAVPQPWTVLPFGAISPKEFLAGLDFFVYYHDTRWVEAFGRTILEAVASGLPAVLPPHFRELFGPAALYAEPDGVRTLVEDLRRNRGEYERHVAQARSFVRKTFGHEAHTHRLHEIIGPPSARSHPGEAEIADTALPRLAISPKPDRPASVRPSVLLISSNGAGMGHLTRLLAYARRIDQEVDPYFLSMSQAVPVVDRFGYPYEYLPSAGALSMPPGRWQSMFIERTIECLNRVQPDVVVFDGTWPYNGFPALRRARPDIRWIWSRRAMWRHGANSEQLRKSEWFDLVLEPGDFASAYDRGATTSVSALRVPPVTLLDAAEKQDRSTARRSLGLPEGGPLALVSLGAGNINDPAGDIGVAAAALTNLGVGVCVTQPEIARVHFARANVHLVRDYPLARRYPAFDLVVSASGYNSFQELLRMSVPTLFVPNTATALDDQESRAKYARDQGWSHMLNKMTVNSVEPILNDLLKNGRNMVAKALEVDPGNGARDAADAILGLVNKPTRWVGRE